MPGLRSCPFLLQTILFILGINHVICALYSEGEDPFLRGFIGCSLQSDVCRPSEKCVNDGLFGRCIDTFDRSVPITIHGNVVLESRQSLMPDLEFVGADVDWHDLQIQCYLRTMIKQIKTGKSDGDPQFLCGMQSTLNTFSTKPAFHKSPWLRTSDIYQSNEEIGLNPLVTWFQNMNEYQPSDVGHPSRRIHNRLIEHNPLINGSDQSAIGSVEELRAIEKKYNINKKILHTDKTINIPDDSGNIIPKRRYTLNIPRDALPPKTPVRSWLWTKFIGRTLNAYEAEYFLSELADRLHMSLPITNYHLDHTGRFLSFQVPDASGAKVDAVAEALNHGQGNFDGFHIESVGFGRGVPLHHAMRRTVSAVEKYPITLLMCLSILAFLVLLAFIYVFNYFRRRIARARGLEEDLTHISVKTDDSVFEKNNSFWNRMKSAFDRKLSKTKKFSTTAPCDPESVATSVLCLQKEVHELEPLCQTSNEPNKTESRSKKSSGVVEHKDSVNSQRSSSSSWSSEPPSFTIDVNTGHMILTYMERFLHEPDLMRSEWATVDKYEAEEATPCMDAQKPENLNKNRPFAPLPYEHSRVRLRNPVNDYINASLIYDSNPRNAVYIATPTPMLTTLSDFWQMVWEQSSVVLVCLERANEMKQPEQGNMEAVNNDASVQYWPREGSRAYGDFEVHLVSEHSWCEQYSVRSFYLKNLETGETRTVTQFHYMTWDDGTLNKQAGAILELRRKVNRSFRGIVSPIVVSCCDGSGRSGTYILLDIVLNRLSKDLKELNIAASLEHLRDQRPSMIQNKVQYEFVFIAVAQEVDMILNTRCQAG